MGRILNKIKGQKYNIKCFFVLLGVISLVIGVYQCIYSEVASNPYLFASHNQINETSDEGVYSALRDENIIRLHVLANSDSSEDQKLKLDIRDLITEKLDGELDNIDDVEKAEKKLHTKKFEISSEIEDFLDKKGYNYEVETKVKEEYFPTRRYYNGVLEGDKYISFNVVIGEGQGENWWCVLFPPLCYVDLAVRDDFHDESKKELEEGKSQDDEVEEKEVKTEADKQIKFFIFEWLNNLL
ncbi:stage II sporulation protein R [Natranaerofaba carboxydovora]|uniref:stage II sporulation protein R n=1 Tax=Natranaerofaba carboxydovora TaxID=2742683 RepID=UPI001F13AE80|nr:stage II sporulation protein R [Natranaerofaba carboxydovora]UMZ75124.1 Stage II sporulation protein R (spore_II_R) [Natranaerofaba carboxydovora]